MVNYETIVYDKINLQIGYTDSSKEVFDLPKDHPDYRKKCCGILLLDFSKFHV